MNFNYIAKSNIDLLKNQILKIKDWDQYEFRQKTYDVHKKTKTIRLIYDEDFRHDNPTYHTDYYKYIKSIDMFKEILNKELGEGSIIRAILVNLLSKNKIDEHIDSGYSLSNSIRIHIPIITNDEVYFKVGEEKKNLKSGEMWQINNTNKFHSVENNSNQDRIHLIIDWIKNEFES